MGRITLWTPGAEALFGYTAEEALGQSLAITFTPEDRADRVPEEELRTALERGVAPDERWHQRKDGSRFYASGKTTPFYQEIGRLLGFTKVCQDLTGEMKRREWLEQNEERYRVLVELSPQGVWFGRADGYITYCNHHWIDVTGLSLQETEGDGWLRAILPDHHDRVLGIWKEAVRTGRDAEVEMPVITRLGEVRWYLARARPVRDEKGQVNRWIGIAIDIHERKLAEFAQASFRVLFESLPSLYAVIDPGDYTIVAVSEAYLQATMRDRQSLIHHHLFEMFPNDPARPEVQGVENMKASFERVKAFRRTDVMAIQQYPIRRPEALGGGFEDRWWSVINSPVFGQNGELLHIIHRVEDVSEFVQGNEAERLPAEENESTRRERLQSEIVLRGRELQRLNEQLIQSEQQYRAMFDVASVGMLQADPHDGRLLHVNQKFCSITGYSMEELLSMRTIDLTHPDEQEAEWEAFQRASREETSHYLSEKRYVCKNRKVVWVRVSAAFVRDATHRATQTFAVVEEITARKEAEHQLQQADQRKTEFLAMLAHELRNPLAAVRTAVQACREEPSTEVYEWSVMVIERQAAQLSRLVDDLLDVSRITLGMIRLHKEPLDAAAVLDHAVEAASPLLNEHHHELILSYDHSGNALPLKADPARLEQIVLNLLTNAAKYTDDGGRIVLSAHREGGRIVLSVRDNGMGIPEEKLSELFELFAQGERGLARSEGGLGIGLAIVKRLTAMHGGTVFARSGGFGEGSEFIVHLPAIEPAAIRVTRPAAPPPAETPRPAKILIVDDNQDTADGLARLLRRRGYMVAVAYDGPTGLDAALNSSPEYVLLDIGLPGLDGYEVAARLREEQHAGSAMTLIAISGYGQEGDRQRSRAAGFDFHLTKPLNFTELEALLLPERREALSSWQH